MGFTREQLALCQGATVPDLAGPGMRLAFVGINPGLWTAMTGIHFAHPSNRFYPALLTAGILDRPVDVRPDHPSVPLPGVPVADEDRAHLIARGIGITNLVARATARAAELTAAELVTGRDRLEAFVERHRPRVVAVAGVTAYRVAFAEPRAALGHQERTLADATLWVVPNPSGLNAHETLETLATRYREPAVAAGVVS